MLVWYVRSFLEDSFFLNISKHTIRSLQVLTSIRTLIDVVEAEGSYISDEKVWMQILQALSSLNRFLVISSASAVTRYKTWDEIPEKNRERYKRDLVRNKIPLSSGLAFKILLAMDRTRIQVVERIFSSNTVKYPAVVLETFLSALLKLARVEISKRRTESLWTLQKAVDVASVNLSRLSRLEWRRIWPVLSAHLVAVACDDRPDVSMCAINALKQMSLMFLAKDELKGFRFQSSVLQSFCRAIRKSKSKSTRELILAVRLRDSLYVIVVIFTHTHTHRYNVILSNCVVRSYDPDGEVFWQYLRTPQMILSPSFAITRLKCCHLR